MDADDEEELFWRIVEKRGGFRGVGGKMMIGGSSREIDHLIAYLIVERSAYVTYQVRHLIG